MTDTNIACPKCGAEIPLTEAVSHRVREQLAADFEKQRGELNAALAAREQKLAAERAAIELRAHAVQSEVSKQLDTERKRLTTEATRQAEEKLGAQLKDTQALLESQQARLKQAQDAELDLRRQQRALDEARAGLELSVERRLTEERQKIAEAARQQGAEAAREAGEKLGAQLKEAQSRLEAQQAKLKLAQDAELELRRQQRELEEAKAALELDVARRLDAERQKIADTARQQGADAERLKVADKDNVIKGLQEQIASLQQRAEQGSMQLQGETLELELENHLRAAFPFDSLAEIKKGQRGADVSQRVRTNTGLDCGAILWEAKRAKNWSADWPEKLKEDQREAKAELAVIVTTCPPETVRGIGPVDGVWVCEPLFAVALASALRQGLISTAGQRLQNTGRADKMSLLYDYLCGVEFRQHVQAVVEAFLALQEQLAAEQRAFAKQWKEREQQLQKAITHTAMLYGGIQGIAGREALPEIQTLQLPA